MRRPEPGEYARYYQSYIDLTRGADFLQNLEDSADVLLDLLQELPVEKRNDAYAEGKWTIAQLLQHLIDADTVFTSRALWLARAESTDLPGFEENDWAENSLKSHLVWDEQTSQFKLLRNFSITLFHTFPESILDREGIINGHTTKLRSIPFIMAGHTFHHINVLKERYL